jgi:hypothetical protein
MVSVSEVFDPVPSVDPPDIFEAVRLGYLFPKSSSIILAVFKPLLVLRSLLSDKTSPHLVAKATQAS